MDERTPGKSHIAAVRLLTAAASSEVFQIVYTLSFPYECYERRTVS